MQRLFTFLMVLVLAALGLGAAPAAPKAQLPVLTTSAGQSNDVITLNIILEEARVGYDYCDVPTPALMATGVGFGGAKPGAGFHVESYTDRAKYPAGTPFKTVMVAVGASLKGMGASGLTVEAEVARVKKVLTYAREQGMRVIAAHVGGKAARGAPGSDNELMIDTVAPFADQWIVTADGNEDGRFTALARQRGVPLTVVKYAVDIVPIVKSMFGGS